jgi:hypothetical protein
VVLYAEKNWNITLPGFSGDDIKLYRKQVIPIIRNEFMQISCLSFILFRRKLLDNYILKFIGFGIRIAECE